MNDSNDRAASSPPVSSALSASAVPFGLPAAGTIALVPPRFGPGVVGGAEAVLADIARGLAARGHNVEILTTCARDHFTWANEFMPGIETEAVAGGPPLVIRRFPTELNTKGTARDRIGHQILSGQSVAVQDQQLWINDSLRCSGLWDHVFDHGHRYRALIFAPYMFWTTYAVSQIHPDRSIIMPCLHDEPPAALDIFASMIEGARGLLFLADPEYDLADRLYRLPARHRVVGAPVDVPLHYDAERFRAEHGIVGPYVYYAGRREWGKGWDALLDGYARYLRLRPGGDAVRLVTSGVGQVEPRPGTEGHVVDLGLISARDRDDAMAGAAAYIQPSAMESFSRTVLEAFLAGTPVVANRASEVVSWHVANSGGGLTYRNESELVECLNFVTEEPAAARAMAADARAYVLDRYRLDPVVTRIEAALDDWLPRPGGADRATEIGLGADRPLSGPPAIPAPPEAPAARAGEVVR
jgi:glycosyltransferase involved in cell wall biosynthesis